MSQFDPTTDLVLRWEFNEQEMRKLNIWMPQPEPQEPLKLYSFSSSERTSTYYRYNILTGRYENAGSIEWNSVRNIRLNMGLRSLGIEEMTRKNKASSRSRRFKALNNVEYKWRPVDTEPANLECVTVTGRKSVALYNNTDQTMRVHPRGHAVLDDIVVLCLVHLWRRSQGFDFQLPEAEATSSTA